MFVLRHQFLRITERLLIEQTDIPLDACDERILEVEVHLLMPDVGQHTHEAEGRFDLLEDLLIHLVDGLLDELEVVTNGTDEVGEVVPPLMVQVDDDVHLFFNHLLDHSAVRACVALNRLK